jgi:hypothetical protein
MSSDKKENGIKALEALIRLNSFDYENRCTTSGQLRLGWECYRYLENIGLYHNYKIREAYIQNLIMNARQNFYNNKILGRRITGGDFAPLPPVEMKTALISKSKITLNTTIGTIDKTHAYSDNDSEKYRIYGPDTNYEFIFCLLNRKSYTPVFCVMIPNYEKNGVRVGIEAGTNIQNKLHNRYLEQKSKIENGENPGRDSYEVKWSDIEEDPDIEILINSVDDIERTQ